MSPLRTGLLASSIALSGLLAGNANGTPLLGSIASIDTDLGIGFNVGEDTCKSGFGAGPVLDPGVELTSANYTGSCSGFVSVDITDNQFTVGGVRESGVGDYRWLTLVVDFVGAGPITSVSLISQSLFQAGTDNPTPSIVFDADSISVTWTSFGAATAIFELKDGGSAVFAVNSANVPAPAGIALLGIALAGLAVARRASSTR